MSSFVWKNVHLVFMRILYIKNRITIFILLTLQTFGETAVEQLTNVWPKGTFKLNSRNVNNVQIPLHLEWWLCLFTEENVSCMQHIIWSWGRISLSNIKMLQVIKELQCRSIFPLGGMIVWRLCLLPPWDKHLRQVLLKSILRKKNRHKNMVSNIQPSWVN